MRLFFILISLFVFTFAQANNNVDFDRAYLGVQTKNISVAKAKLLGFDNPHGSYVTTVFKNTAAHKAGLQAFDYIVAINDYELSKEKSLGRILNKFESDEEVTIHFYRNGEKRSQKVTLGSREARDFEYSDRSENAFLGITPHKKNQNDELGVRVNVINFSAAHEMGIQDGDLIAQINGATMIDWQDIDTAIDNLNAGDAVTINYNRGGQTLEGTVNIKSYEETNEIRRSKKYDRAFLGINFSKISKKKAKKLNIDNPYGSYVTGVIPNTAAEKAGVRVFDYLFGVDEYRVGESQSMGGILAKYSAGDAATLHVIRKGNIKKLNVNFGRKSDAQPIKRSKCEDPFFGIQKSHKTPAENGIRVSVVKNSTAQEVGLKNEDVITAINGFTMVDWDDISAAIDQLEVGEDIKVNYERNGNKMEGSKAIKSYCETKGKEDSGFKIDLGLDDDDFDFDFDFDWDDDDDDDDDDREFRSADMRNVDGMKVELSDLSKAEADEMKTQHGLNMPTVNNLSIENINLFPNPSKGMFRLSFDLPQSGETSIKIYNSQGREIYDYDLGEFTGDFSDEVDISQNGTGTYFLEIRQDGKSKTQKIILKRS